VSDDSRQFHEGQSLFQGLRYGAVFEKVLGAVRGNPTFLCSFEGVRRDLQLHDAVYQGIQEVPLSLIVGSVGRDHDFTRHFRPLRSELRDRWAGVYIRMMGLTGYPRSKYTGCATRTL
jgi:hypothetical protein